MRPFSRQRLIEMLPLWGAVAVGVGVAGTALVVPLGWIESLAWRSGLATILPLAEPPLGGTARIALALGGGMGIAAVVWSALFLLWGPGGFLVPKRSGPQVRRADAHPDAPPRPPLSAAELGEPLPPPPVVERDIPADLDQPLAAFDPAAIPAVPRAPVRPVAPLAPSPALVKGERIETFDLSPRGPGDNQPSIEQLLRRLELGTSRRPVAVR